MAREMKDSGIEWIGSIPANWMLSRMKTCIVSRDSGAWGEEATGNDGDTICLRIADFDYGKFRFKNTPIEELTKRNYAKDVIQRLTLQNEDILIEKSGGGEKTPVGRTVIFDKPYIALYANFMDRLRCSANVTPYFMQYVFITFYKNEYTRNYIKQTTGIQNLDLTSMLSDEFVPLPGLEEQSRIAAFLDRKCAEIDSVMADTQRTIEEYKALKQSIITEAVTKGVRGKRTMKDSGIEYCDAIPSDWNITRMAFANWIRARLGWKGLKAEEYVDVGYPFLSAFNIINDKLVWCDLNHITQERYDESPEIKLLVGDILLVKDGAGIGKCGRIDELPLGEATVNSSLAVITPNENLYYKYEYYYFLCDAFQKVITVLRNGMGVPHLTQEIMKGIRIPLPSKEEQIEIAEYLDKKSADIDKIISAKETLLTELESYKKSVIYEYVTGKKEAPACL